jgi:anti-sigma-K factor RskA
MSDQPTDRSRVDDLLGAYALDAVEPEERELVERHLSVDPDARAEVDAMRETASVLASIPREAHDAPDGLWERIAAAIQTDDEAPERPAIAPIPITRARRSRSVPMKVFAPIVAAAAIAVAVLGVAVANRPPNRAGNVAAAYDDAVAHGAATIPLDAGTNGPVAAEIALRADGTGYLRNDHLGALPSGRTYQLWALVGTGSAQRAISAGVLGPDPHAVAFHVATRPDAFAITVERAPGVVQSTQQPAAVGEVRT